MRPPGQGPKAPAPGQDGEGLTRAQRGTIAKIDNIVREGAKDHDFEGVARELRGEDTGFDHVTEMRNNVRGLRDALGSIRGSLHNPYLAPDVRLWLEAAALKGQEALDRMLEALASGR